MKYHQVLALFCYCPVGIWFCPLSEGGCWAIDDPLVGPRRSVLVSPFIGVFFIFNLGLL